MHMENQNAHPARPSGLYVGAEAGRRAAFETACADLFGELRLAGDPAEAARGLESSPVARLVIDLDRLDPELDLAGVSALLAQAGGSSCLLVCPYASARWLPALAGKADFDYVLGPLAAPALRDCVHDWLEGRRAACAEVAGLATVRDRMVRSLADAQEPASLPTRLCEVLARWPGVVHAALFVRAADGGLRLAAQQPEGGVDLAGLLGGTQDLEHSPARHAFPGMLAALSGELVLLDALDKADAPELTEALRAQGVAAAFGVPLPASGPDAPRGALSLLFGPCLSRPRQAWPVQALGELEELGRLAGLALRLCGLAGENAALRARLARAARLDALTGVVNRRHGEDLLEQEIRRSRRYGTPLSLIVFGIDGFTAINDSYGPPVGDLVLRTVADAATGVLRASDVLVRSGSEEFRVIALHTTAADALTIADKLRQTVARTDVPGCDHATVTLAVVQLGELESGDSLVVRANAALARARRAGGDRVELAMQ